MPVNQAAHEIHRGSPALKESNEFYSRDWGAHGLITVNLNGFETFGKGYFYCVILQWRIDTGLTGTYAISGLAYPSPLENFPRNAVRNYELGSSERRTEPSALKAEVSSSVSSGSPHLALRSTAPRLP